MKGGEGVVHLFMSTTVSVPSSELGPPTPLPLASVPLNQKGGGHTRLWVRGWGSPNLDNLRKSLALCLLCDVHRTYVV
jgi:hypothetical protein